MPIVPRMPATLAYGGDYNPEQWPESVWLDDVRLMREAGVNLVSLAIFSWSRLQPTETTFDFGWLDRIMDLLAANGINVCLATSTASPPPWLAVNYPDVLPVDANGLPLHHGSRSHFSPSSPSYRRFAAALIRRLAERYRDHPALVAWHINNEFACHTTECHSEASTTAFRAWLKNKYGSLDALNAAWGTDFWSQRYADWSEIFTPRRAPYHRNPAQQLDYRRFMSDAFLEIYRMERGLVAEIAPGVPATTNLIWFLRPIDAHRWAGDLDFASWDCYPDTVKASGEEHFSAVGHDVIRSLKKDRPFLLIEQAPSAVTWRPVNPPKPPGLMRLWSLQAIARGADGVMFFQWRASRTGAEKYLTGMLGHGDPAQSRVFAEIKQLGAELKKLAPLADTLIHARVAIVFSWEVGWALELEGKPAQIDYPGWASALHRYFFDRNIPVDFVAPAADLTDYALVLAPALYLLREADATRLTRFVENGGTLLATYFSGIVDENEQVVLGGYPGHLRRMLGLRVEEWIPLAEHQSNQVRFDNGLVATAKSWTEIVHLEGATAFAHYTDGFHAASPAITVNRCGTGHAFYLSTQPDENGLIAVLDRVIATTDIAPVLATPRHVEVTLRQHGDRRFLCLLNHGPAAATVDLGVHRGTNLLTGRVVADRLELAAHDAAFVQLT